MVSWRWCLGGGVLEVVSWRWCPEGGVREEVMEMTETTECGLTTSRVRF